MFPQGNGCKTTFRRPQKPALLVSWPSPALNDLRSTAQDARQLAQADGCGSLQPQGTSLACRRYRRHRLPSAGLSPAANRSIQQSGCGNAVGRRLHGGESDSPRRCGAFRSRSPFDKGTRVGSSRYFRGKAIPGSILRRGGWSRPSDRQGGQSVRPKRFCGSASSRA